MDRIAHRVAARFTASGLPQVTHQIRLVPETDLICPHCKTAIHEKGLYHDGTNWFHRAAGCIDKPMEMPPKTAAASLATASMFTVLESWCADFIKMAGNAIPKNLTVDSLAWVPMRRGYCSVEAKGYSKSDLAATATVSILLHGDGSGAQIHLWYKDVMMASEAKEDFKLGVQEDPAPVFEKMKHFFNGR